ncbi:hypothetical protein H312_00418 [Anncaliia algerae PRA339]|uniref:Mediator complex subunit 11 n=1 Tax=Anncaliia algerae PRA339 TaxID=1288291 RepID=A0A059F5C1_9MICR|nr:hypothetical protein H312_00418 [Anncaliia algerae PRA339]
MESRQNFLVKESCKNIEKIVDNIIEILNLLKHTDKSMEVAAAQVLCCKQKMIEIKKYIIAIFKNILELKYLYKYSSKSKEVNFNIEKEFARLLKKEFNYE